MMTTSRTLKGVIFQLSVSLGILLRALGSALTSFLSLPDPSTLIAAAPASSDSTASRTPSSASTASSSSASESSSSPPRDPFLVAVRLASVRFQQHRQIEAEHEQHIARHHQPAAMRRAGHPLPASPRSPLAVLLPLYGLGGVGGGDAETVAGAGP